MTATTVADLTARTGQPVLDHIPTDLDIPVLDGLQAQGDVIVIPGGRLPATGWKPVPAAGVVLVSGQHDHRLVADEGVCEVAFARTGGLDVAYVRCTAPVWLLHAEHGGSGLAAGEYTVRRQREHAEEQRMVAD